MDINSFEQKLKRFAVPECMRPQGMPVTTTTADQTVTEAGFYCFTTYSGGVYMAVSNSAITGWVQYNQSQPMAAYERYWYYLEPGDHFRTTASYISVQRFA